MFPNTNKIRTTIQTIDLTECDSEVIVLDDTLSDLDITEYCADDAIDVEQISCISQETDESTGYISLESSHHQGLKPTIFQISNSKTKIDSDVTISKGKYLELKNIRKNNVTDMNDLNIIINVNNELVATYNKTKKAEDVLKRKRSQSFLLTSNEVSTNSKRGRMENLQSTPSSSSSTSTRSRGSGPSDGILKRHGVLQNVAKRNKKRKGKLVSKWRMSQKKKDQSTVKNQKTNNHTFSKSIRKPVGIVENNFFNPNPYIVDKEGVRPIVIDGSNVAIGHGKGEFSERGVKICVDYFASRGHDNVKVFLPKHRKGHFSEKLLEELRTKCDMVFTPSQIIDGVRKTPYDDRFIVQYAVEFGGVIVSTDNYRDLLKENPRWRETIQRRLLMFTWVDDFLMFPVDPLGKSGPHLEQFLRF